jgi:hypothetical protein
MKRYVTPMPKDNVLRDAVLSRQRAIRQPSAKTLLNFIALGMLADSAVPRHSIKTTHKTSGDNSLR